MPSSCPPSDKTLEFAFQSDGSPMDIKRIKRARVGPAPASPFDDE
jgi:hypothetical protein